MSEILFRGKRTDFNRWIEGYLYRLSEKLNPFIMIKNEGGMAFEVISETVGQYTGLTDKNGKKIFERDIVKLFFKDGTFEVGPIMWSRIDARYKFASPDGAAYGIDRTVCMEVIGNIHDNPELLKGGEG